MKVIKNNEDVVKFDNGLVLGYEHSQDCCEHNYLDFEQLHVGRELPTMDAIKFVAAISLKGDGFSIKDSSGIPLWVQARSVQNGYYPNGVDLVVTDSKLKLRPKRANQGDYAELFSGKENIGD